MTKFEKVYAVILLTVMVIELATLVMIPLVEGICTGRWSKMQMWVLVPWLAADIYALSFIMKHWEGIK